jgi:hypothetical protein
MAGPRHSAISKGLSVRKLIGRFMTDEVWRRHANPWSAYTRFAAMPFLIFSIWSRVWIGWWALIPLGVVIGWLVSHPQHLFAGQQCAKLGR